MKGEEMDWIFGLVDIVCCVIEAYLMIDFYMSFFALREKFERKHIKTVVVIFAACCVRLVNLFNSSALNLVGMQVIYFSLLFILVKGKIVNKMFCHLAANAIMVGCEFLFLLVMSLPADFALAELQNNFLYCIAWTKTLKFHCV